MGALQNKVAIVTGASSGIGRATALLFAREGAKVVVAARRKAELDSLVAEIVSADGVAVAASGDVGDERYAKSLVDIAQTEFGGLDVAFNNAGMLGPMGPTSEIALSDWDAAMRTNLTSGFLAAKFQIPAMVARGGGSIIFTSTIVGYTVGLPNMAAYAASKAGLIGLTQALAVEVATKGVRVNALVPGATDTPMGRESAPTPEAQEFVRGLVAMKRIASSEELARSALYLASDASTFTTGSALVVDGGVSICRT